MGWEKLPSANATLLDGETPQHLWHYYLGQSNPGGVRSLLWPLALAGGRADRVGRLPLPAGLPAGRRCRGDRHRVRGHAPGPALERPGAALLLPVHLPAGRRRRGRGDPVGGHAAGPRPGAARARRSAPRARCSASAPRSSSSASPSARLPGVEYPASGGVRLARVRPQLPQRRAVLGGVELRGPGGQGRGRRPGQKAPEGQGGWPELAAMFATMGGLGPGPRPRVRPGLLGVRRPARDLRHADGADAAAVLHRRVHRLDGGPVLRVVGHHAVPLPHAVRAVGRAARARSGTSRTTRCEFDLGIQQLELLGVRYYMAYTQWAVGQADVERARSRRWRPPGRGTSTSSTRRVGAGHAAAQQARRHAQRRRHPGAVARPVGRLVPRSRTAGTCRSPATAPTTGRASRSPPTRSSRRRVEAGHRQPRPCPPCRTEAVTPGRRSPTSRPVTTASRSTWTSRARRCWSRCPTSRTGRPRAPRARTGSPRT